MIYDLVNQVKAAVDEGNFKKAEGISTDVSVEIARQVAMKRQVVTPSQKYADLKTALPDAPFRRFLALSRVAMAALDAGDLSGAEGYAREVLADTTTFPNFGSGDATFSMAISCWARSR